MFDKFKIIIIYLTSVIPGKVLGGLLSFILNPSFFFLYFSTPFFWVHLFLLFIDTHKKKQTCFELQSDNPENTGY